MKNIDIKIGQIRVGSANFMENMKKRYHDIQNKWEQSKSEKEALNAKLKQYEQLELEIKENNAQLEHETNVLRQGLQLCEIENDKLSRKLKFDKLKSDRFSVENYKGNFEVKNFVKKIC
jgi:predicted nuclease with TOPRIM domain